MWLTRGEPVHLFDTNAAQLDSARAYIDGELPGVIERLVPGGSKGKLLTFQDRSQALKDAWIVVEASTCFVSPCPRRLPYPLHP